MLTQCDGVEWVELETSASTGHEQMLTNPTPWPSLSGDSSFNLTRAIKKHEAYINQNEYFLCYLILIIAPVRKTFIVSNKNKCL